MLSPSSPIPIKSPKSRDPAPPPTPMSSPSASEHTVPDRKGIEEVCAQAKDPAIRRRKPAFFAPFYNSVIRYLQNGRMSPPPFQVHPPRSFDFNTVWNTPPLFIDTNITFHDPPEIETTFESVLFRINLYPDAALRLFMDQPDLVLTPETTLIFRKFDAKHNRYLIEYCQWIDNHKAYLKVVGLTEEGERHRFDDPYFPSFILIIPVCLIGHLPILSIAHDYINAEAYNSVYKDGDGNRILCKICGLRNSVPIPVPA